MKKQEGQERKVSREVLEGIPKIGDYEIVREVREGGEVCYFHPNTHERAPVSCDDLQVVALRPINRLEALIGLLDDDDLDRFGYVAEGIVKEAKQLYDEVFYLLDRDIGKIQVDVMGRRSVVYRSGRILGVRIDPPSSVEGS